MSVGMGGSCGEAIRIIVDFEGLANITDFTSVKPDEVFIKQVIETRTLSPRKSPLGFRV